MADPRGWLAAAAGSAVTSWQPAGGGHGARHYRAALADGREIFVKAAADRTGVPAIHAQARGLGWLCEPAGAPVAGLVAAADGLLALRWVAPGRADRAAAERFGRELAWLHAAGAGAFGAPWAGYIASLPLLNDQAGSWPDWFARTRLLPYCAIAADRGEFGSGDVALIESVAVRIGELAGPAEPPARIHGDCWTGNVLWSAGRGWLIDPAAHGGHRETDLAMLALFGAPHLDRILAAYDEAAPLAAGWRSRVPLHQLHPLLVHVCLFGGAYREQALAAARAALAA
ncbi:MAG TPA: fructosamine kinase family protein [Streptosporangiaceae bacterium]